jgi:integrase/recombinase XerD
MRRPFSLYKEKTKSGTIWYARFWDETAQKYNRSRSTGVLVEGKKERRYEAEEAARKISEKLSQTPVAKPKPKQNIVIVPQESPTLAAVPIPQPVYNKVADTPIIQYLENFWTPTSDYAKYKRDVKHQALTPYYIQMNHDDIRRHVSPCPLFEGVTLGSLTKSILKKYLIWLASRRKTTTKKDGTVVDHGKLSGRRANSVLQAVRVAVRWAVDNDDIPSDPFRNLGEVYEEIKEKGVLTFEERDKLINSPITNFRTRLVMLLGCFCGFRRGEMRGLKWGDILENGLFHIQHSYNNVKGLKPPKYNSIRKVPITSHVQKLLDITRENAVSTSPDNFILESIITTGKEKGKGKGIPLSNNFFRSGVAKELESIGITVAQQKERDITPHSLRHTFITLAQLSGIPEIEIQALAGHKNAYITKKYTHVPQVIDFNEARRKLEAKVVSPLPKAANA